LNGEENVVAQRFAELAFSPAVRSAQEHYGSAAVGARLLAAADRQDRLGPDEAAFLQAGDGFHIATVTAAGWPYVQFRGGPPGFVQVLDDTTIGWADLRGNRQYITAGNLDPAGEARVAMIFMDLANPSRIKLLGRARIVDVADDPALAARLTVDGQPGKVERSVLVDVEAFAWNCPQHITPRYTAEEIARSIRPLHEELAALRAENTRLRAAAEETGGRRSARVQ
jgi:uncharacterized protein